MVGQVDRMAEQVDHSLAAGGIAAVRNLAAHIVVGEVLRKVVAREEHHIGQEEAQEEVLRIGLVEELEIHTVVVAGLSRVSKDSTDASGIGASSMLRNLSLLCRISRSTSEKLQFLLNALKERITHHHIVLAVDILVVVVDTDRVEAHHIALAVVVDIRLAEEEDTGREEERRRAVAVEDIAVGHKEAAESLRGGQFGLCSALGWHTYVLAGDRHNSRLAGMPWYLLLRIDLYRICKVIVEKRR